MKKSMIRQDPARDFDLGAMVGRRQAFGLVAGRCSAAEAECLRRIREEKLYKSRVASWDEFCTRHLGMSRGNADRLIHLLEEFGPAYFELSQLTRIPAEAFRAIAPAVTEKAIHWKGEAIALIPENAERVSAAVADLRRTAPPAAPPRPSTRDRLAALERRCREVVAEFDELSSAGPGDEDRSKLLGAIRGMRILLVRVELKLGP